MDSINNQQSTINNRIVYPVILAVPEKDRQLTGREKVAGLSRHARRALEISAQKSGIALIDLQKDEKGAPLPFNGHYWSVTHKPQYVGGVVAASMIGIDIEKIRPCSEALLKKTVDDSEWGLADADRFSLFFRYWTSKECVLKAVGIGIRDLAKCRIAQVVDDDNLVVNYDGKLWQVEHAVFDGHIASIVKNGCHIQWILIKNQDKL
jgi:4'-phosphopantetheinyl transferase